MDGNKLNQWAPFFHHWIASGSRRGFNGALVRNADGLRKPIRSLNATTSKLIPANALGCTRNFVVNVNGTSLTGRYNLVPKLLVP